MNRNFQIAPIPAGQLRLKPSYLAVRPSAVAFCGCATFPAHGGITVVVNVAGQKDSISIRTTGEAEEARNAVQRLLCRSLTVDTVMKMVFLNNWASHKDLASAEPDLVQKSLQRDPTFSIFRIVGIGALEAEREVVGRILAPSTPSFRFEFERQRFRHAQLCAGNAAARSSRKRAYFRAVAANERIGRMTNVKSTAGSHGSAARHGGEFR